MRMNQIFLWHVSCFFGFAGRIHANGRQTGYVKVEGVEKAFFLLIINQP
jgi:hypothetical protein